MAKSALLEDAPPDGFEDSPPDGFEESPTVTAQRPKMNAAALDVREPEPGDQPLSPAMTAYRRGLVSFLAGDRAGAEIHSKEALRIDPNLTEASRMLDRLRFNPQAGTSAMVTNETPSVDTGRNDNRGAAEVATGLVKSAIPPFPGIGTKPPTSIPELLNTLNIGNLPGVEKVEVAGQKVKSAALNILEPKQTERGGKAAPIFGKLILAPLEASLGIPPGALGKIEKEVGEQAVGETGQNVVREAVGMFPFTPNEFQQWLGAEAPGIFAPAVVTRLIEKFPVLGKRFNMADVGPALKEFVLTKNVKIPVGKEEMKGFYTFGRESLDPWLYEQLTGKSPSEVKAMLKDALAGKPVFLEKRVPRFGRDSGQKTIPEEGRPQGRPADGSPLSVFGQDVAPVDKVGQSAYPVGNESSGATQGGSGGIVPGGGDGGPTVQGSSPDNPPDGFIDGPGVSVGQEIQPQRQQPELGTASTLATSAENVALPPSPPVQDIGQSAQPQSETNPQPPVEPSAPSGKFPKKQTKKEKQLTPLEGLASVVPRRSTLPILTGFNVKNGVASATDMTSYLEMKVDLPDGHYKMVGKNVEKSGLDQNEFPVSPMIGNKIGTVDRSDLIRNFDRVEKASADDETRYILQSVNLKSENGKAYLTATDGRRLSTSPLDSAKLPDGSYIIPANLGVGKSLKALSGDTLDISVINGSDGNPEAISFTSPNGRVVSRLMEGNYPNINQVIPEPTEQIVFPKAVLENALKELKPYLKEAETKTVLVDRNGDNISLRVINQKNKLDKTIIVKGKTVKGDYAKIKAGSVVMPMQMNERLAKLGIELGPGHLGGFEFGYLQDAVSSVSGNEIYLGRTDDPLKPVVVRGKPFDKFVAAKKAKRRGPGKGAQASTGGGSIESFEQNTGPIYYSQLQRTIEQKMPNSAPAAMVRALTDPAKGNVKAEEVEWSGINEFLQGKEKVSKTELLDFLKSNEVQIKEVRKGLPDRKRLDELESKIDLSLHLSKEDLEEYNKLIHERTQARSGGEPKFSSYQLPGGKNYREVLLTLPGMPDSIVKSPQGTILRYDKNEFRSSHFDEPNILAHVRMNDRTTADGKRVLFLEEVQSDWHQKGREQGYRDDKFKVEAEKRLEEIRNAKESLAIDREPVTNMMRDEKTWHRLSDEQAEITDEYNRRVNDSLPNAPFKKTWHELALKRMLRYAVDNGYDGIAWTTGEQQAERYDLSKQLSEVVVSKIGGGVHLGSFMVEAKDKNGKTVIEQPFTKEELPNAIGKELANKALNDLGDKPAHKPSGLKNEAVYKGLDLKVGGEGMKGFYDQMIPSFLNKYTKKWGGRVGEQLISFVPEEKYDIRNTGSRWQLVVRSTGERVPNSPLFNSGNDAENWILKNRQTTVHSLDITPSMRTSVSQGQPLFAKGTAKDSAKIEAFEQLTPKEQEQTFKMATKVRDLVKKYAVRVGERYVPRRAAGAYYPKTQNIRLNSLNDLSVAIHEITHSIDDAKARTSEKILNARDRETVKGLTEIYTTYYATGKSNHAVKLRIVEGLATLIQKTAESPTMMYEKYGTLLDKFTNSGGRYYDTNYVDLLADAREIVGDFQLLDKLSQVGAFVTSKFQQKEARDSFLSAWDKIRSEMSDAVWPVEKAARKAGLERKAGDPSLWMRAYQGIVGNIENNMVGSKGFWIPTQDGGFKKVSDKNFSDLLGELGKLHIEDRFGWWLIARDSYFEWKRLDKITAEIEGLKEKIQLLPETMTPELMAEKKGLIRLLSEKQVEHDEFMQRLNREPLGRSTFERAYLENKNDFQAFGKTFDTFTAANLDLIEMADMATPEQLDVLRQKEGYAPKKRDIYDDIIGSEQQSLPAIKVGKTKLSSMMARKGSSLSYVNPLYSVIKDHAEIMRKSMKQMVYNKMLSIAPSWPEVFHPVELKVVVDKQTGKMTFPQEKDQNIIIARWTDGKRSPLLVGRDMKNVIDDVLGFHDIHLFERLLRKSARMFSQLTTGAYPPFILTNLAMDIPTAIANTRTKMTPVYSALKELGKAITSSDTPEAKYAAEWLASHGERQSLMGWQTLDPDEYFRLLQKEKNWIERATQSIANGIDFLSIPGKYSEIMSRMTEYILSRKAGNPWIVAMEDSARVTTPFTHIGRWGGGTWMKTLVKSIPFFNPGIQGLDQFVRSASQKDTQKRLLFVLTATVLASVAGMSWIMKHATDEQKDQYKDLEGASLTGHVWFPSSDGKNLIKVRVLEQFGWLAALLNMAIGETIYGVDYKFRDYADAATSLVPNQFDISNPVMALLNWVPQIIKPSLEVIFDKRTFPTVRPLTPRNQQNIKPGLRSTETTSSVAKELGKRLDLSPIAIDHLIEGYLGRTARFGTGRFYSMKMNPFFQDWYFTSGRNLQDFYDTRERWQYLNTEFKTNPRGIPDEEKRAYFHNGPIIKKIEARLEVIREYQKVGKPLKGEKLYRNRHAILEDIAKLK